MRSATLLIAAATCMPTMAEAQLAPRLSLELERFIPETRTLAHGDTAVSTLIVRNGGSEAVWLWFGYSVQDASGDWHDVEPIRVGIGAHGRHAQRMSWVLPVDRPLPAGRYRVVMAVWSDRPGKEGAVRLANGDRREAFTVRSDPAIVGPEGNLWRTGDHYLGRGRFRPDNVARNEGGYRLTLSANSCDGGELRSTTHMHYGVFSARMRTPLATGSISAFFFYGSARGKNDEIDIEIYNDGSRRALLTAWIDGRKTHGSEVVLPFDPASDFHEYQMRWSANELSLVADSLILASWGSGYPTEPMRLMANVWWPNWLTCTPLSEPRHLEIEEIVQRPAVP